MPAVSLAMIKYEWSIKGRMEGMTVSILSLNFLFLAYISAPFKARFQAVHAQYECLNINNN